MNSLWKIINAVIFAFIVFVLFGCEMSNKEYTITFNSNGGSEVAPITEAYNAVLTKPNDPTKLGYTFVGWYLDSEFYDSYTFTKMEAKNLILYAKWDINKYIVEFIDYDDTLIQSIEVAYGESAKAPLSLHREGYIFTGWDKSVDNIQSYTKIYATYDKQIVDDEKQKLIIDESMQDAVDEMYKYYGESSTSYLLPSKGNVNILVIPIQFPNDKFTNTELASIEYGFFGDGLRYETLTSYYLKSSYGALNIRGDVLNPYTAQNNYDYYKYYTSQLNEYADGVDLLIEESVNYYLHNNPNLDLSKYDSEGDGFIDAIHIVYSAPMDYDSDETFFWAYQYYYSATAGTQDTDYVSWDEYEIDSYVFSSVDFFYEYQIENAWTIIHETGHLLGLEDYYDYTPEEDSNKGGLGSIDMMDSTMGDHNPFSKLILNWVDPIIVTESCTVTINKFATSGDAIIVTNQFNSIFDEYFIMNFYTPTGLNEENQYLTEKGLLMYHVNAKLPSNYDYLSDNSYYLEYNNSDSKYKLIKIEEADGNNSISNQLSTASNSDLLQVGDSYHLKMYNYRSLCEVKVLDVTDNTITLSFIFE